MHLVIVIAGLSAMSGISQGSVTIDTYEVWWDLCVNVITNFLLIPTVKEF